MSIDFIFRGSAESLDPDLAELVEREDQRQMRKIILIASESMAPAAVRELMSSSFGNVYAEGYPRWESRKQEVSEILDVEAELAYYRRYSDPRYYKGVEYADILEALARRRAAELFAANGVSADELYVNVQPLSGSPANNEVYGTLMEPGETLMGLDLIDGGHLTHGSKVNRSGGLYNAVTYRLDPESERLDYDAIEAQAMEARPRVIIAGYTAYPLQVDWQRFRSIADRCGAYLVGDIAHISGLVAAGVHPSPIGIADVVTTTTHKSLCGPRGAMIMTHHAELARRIDRSVFPGEQGGPHLNTIAALALALKLARSPQFKALQERVVDNAARLAGKLAERGLRIVSGGTENHLLLVDTKSIQRDGLPLSGDMAARILDLAGYVTNRNTIPGDKSAFAASGVRIGTVWISQLGYGEDEIDLLAEGLAAVLKGCQPFTYTGPGGRDLLRAKIDPAALRYGREVVCRLTGYQEEVASGAIVEVRGGPSTDFLNHALTSDVLGLAIEQVQPTRLIGPGFAAEASLKRQSEESYLIQLGDATTAHTAAHWLRDLSDGFVLFDDLYAKMPGPVVAQQLDSDAEVGEPLAATEAVVPGKPYFVGHRQLETTLEALPPFEYSEPEDAPLKQTALHAAHVAMGGRMVPFGGWDMPVWYTSVSEEHAAVRQAAGLFDVSHMGVLEASGPHAAPFLNLVTTNDVSALAPGHSHYTYLLLPDGSVVDDLLVYRLSFDRFMLVVNAANNDKDWAWLNAVNDGQVQIDLDRPWIRRQHPAVLRDLRDSRWGDDCRVDLALQGPASTDILLSMCDDEVLAKRIRKLPWAGLTQGTLGGFDLIISRTGYTGERVAYELFVHPAKALELWSELLRFGEPFGLRPCGLAARDSTRTEAGLPLYGHELDGPLGLNPADAGFASYVKLWKPFFIGRQAFIDHEAKRDRVVVRFRMNEKGVRRPELGDPILDRRGKVVGQVTSCAIDSEGFLLGQGVVPLAVADPGTTLSIYQLGGGQRKLRAPEDISLGARLPVPDLATVLTRFPKRS